MAGSRLPEINSVSSAFGCFAVFIILCICSINWALKTRMHQQDAENQQIVEATISAQQVRKELVDGFLTQLPSSEVFVLRTTFQYIHHGKSDTCIVQSLPLSVMDIDMFQKSSPTKIGEKKKIYLTHRNSSALCRLDRHPDIDAVDWAIISVFGFFTLIFGALYVYAFIEFIKE